MKRLTLRLPDSLHRRLVEAAGREGVSLNQYLVYLLAQGAASPFSVRPVPVSEVREQEGSYGDLLAEMGTATDEELRAALDERDAVAPEEGITASLIERLHFR
jgi:hypothetical protein